MGGPSNIDLYTLKDGEYRSYMMAVLTSLEPRIESKGFYFLEELDEFGEITFVMNGRVGVGFEVNGTKMICHQKKTIVIGAFGLTFNQRA